MNAEIKKGKDITEYFFETGKTTEQLKQILLKNEINDFEIYFIKESSKYIRIELNSTFIKNENDELDTVIFMFKDIHSRYRREKLLSTIIEEQTDEIKKSFEKKTEQDNIILKLTQENIEKTMKTIEEQEELIKLKTEFISKASHEFRTPLATMEMALETIKKYHDKMNKEQLEEIGRAHV